MLLRGLNGSFDLRHWTSRSALGWDGGGSCVLPSEELEDVAGDIGGGTMQIRRTDLNSWGVGGSSGIALRKTYLSEGHVHFRR